MRTCIDNRKRKVFNDIKHLSTKAVLLIIFLSLLPALQVIADVREFQFLIRRNLD